MNEYPVLGFMVRHAAALAAGTGALPLAGGLAAVLAGAHWLFLPAGALVAVFAFVMMKSYLELVSLIVDMLLPK